MTQQTAPPRGWRKKEYLVLALIVLLGAVLRFARSGYDVLSFDEQWHVELSTARGSVHMTLPLDAVIDDAPPTGTLKGAPPWYRVWTSLGQAVHPPLYFVTLRLWRELFGEAVQTARTMSILLSLGTIVLIFEAGRRMVGVLPALGAALLFAVAPNQVYINQQVRGYAMLQFWGVASMLMVLLIEKADRPSVWKSVTLGVCVLGMMLTHYFAIGGAVAIGLYVLIRLRGRARWQAVGALLLAGVVYAIIWLPQTTPQREWAVEADTWLGDDRGGRARLSTIARVATAPWREIISDTPNHTNRNPRLDAPWPYLGIVLFVLPPFLLRRRPGMLLGYIWMLAAIGFIAMLDLTRATTHLRFTRYITLAAPGVFLVFTSLLSLLPRWLGQALFAAATIAALGLSQHIYQKEEGDWQRIGQILDEHAHPGEAVAVYHGTVPRASFTGYYYLAAAFYSDQFPRPLLKLSGPADPSLVDDLPGQTAWLITTPNEPRPGDVLPGVTVLEQYDVPRLVTCWRVALPGASATTAPLQTGSSAP